MRNRIIVCRLSLIKTYLLAFHILRKFPDSAPLINFITLQGVSVSATEHGQALVLFAIQMTVQNF